MFEVSESVELGLVFLLIVIGLGLLYGLQKWVRKAAEDEDS
ncbi:MULTISPECIES: hypothetical protein [Limnochorda]|nr:hypothetical protein [Limnochorda pilosa]